jgi:estrogen-related receptor beta like 1
VDPIHWKTELERVGPKLRAKQALPSNEWRAHVDMTVLNKGRIEAVLDETQADLTGLNREVSEELSKMRNKERYMNNQFAALCHEYKEVKGKFEGLEGSSGKTNETVVKLTNDLAEVTDRLEELKESFDSRDSGMHDTSPLVRIKAALQQIKAEAHEFDLRLGVVSHSVLAARVASTNRKRVGAAQSARKRRQKGGRKGGPGASKNSNSGYDNDSS